MTAQDSATHCGAIAVRGGSGTLLALLGVGMFSLTFPATVWALDGLGPWSVTACRAVLGGLVAAGFLAARRERLPDRRHLVPLTVVAAGVVVGFPLLTTLALGSSTTSHAAVVVGLLPVTTAAYAAVRTGARHSAAFWAAALTGAAVVVAFAAYQSGGRPGTGDLYLFAALLVCAAGYAEGGLLARELPGWQVIGWALVFSLPLALAGAAVALALEPFRLTGQATAGMLWLGFSTFVSMWVWYRAMALTGVARAGQLQLAQPLLTLVWSVTLLGERIGPAAPLAAVAVLACIAVTQRAGSPTRSDRRPSPAASANLDLDVSRSVPRQS
ncbi:DMT family transporter [Streptomyces caatingaensis]|uniref:Membrane protein n=1 Tax=Streptomyces caatingaensis TaxID=1678637 RepID=A0A0K9X985_9ACTN|nr:DMT family transporter [Streptomyces caatingaensis]KNB49758.1 membrane protein [Streptomyces caatingaensis]